MEMPGQAPDVPVKKKVVRQSFMGETCPHEGCHREFKIEKDYTKYKLTCPYCHKTVDSVRILKAQVPR